MAIQNVLLIGAGGNLGPAILNGLLEGKFNVTVLSRKGSKSKFPEHVKVVQISEDYPHDELVAAFKGQDAVVSNVGGAALEAQKRMVDAVIEAGVQRFIPSEFGSAPRDDDPQKPMMRNKASMREYLRSKESAGLSWTGVICNAFFEWGLAIGFLKLDIKNRTQTVADSGDAKFPVSNWRTVAAAVNGVLRKPEETKNRYVYVESFSISLNQLRDAVEKVLGEKIEVTERVDSKEYLAKQIEAANNGDHIAEYHWIWILFARGEDLTGKLDNKLLEIPEEDFQGTVERVVKEVLAKN